ncbi:23197_t:CDS:1, partial [Dentiscutata erythropus]
NTQESKMRLANVSISKCTKEELKTLCAYKKRKISSATNQYGEDKANKTFAVLFIKC